MAAAIILLEAMPRRASDGVAETVRLAGGGSVVPYRYFGQHWRAGLAGLPKSSASLDHEGEQLGGGGSAQAMELRWAPASNGALAQLAAYYWGDAPVTVRIGPEGANPPVVTAGLVMETAVEKGQLVIALADQMPALKRPVLVDRFAGTGDLEGPAEWKNLLKSRSWGPNFNVPGRCIDPAYNIWCFGDPARPWQAFNAVRDRGANAAALAPQGWQGSMAATLASLRAADPPEGGGVVCPSLACVRWWTEPGGDLHADISGETAGGYVATAPEIAARLVVGADLAFAPGAVAAAAALRPDAFGWRVATEGATIAGELSAMLGDVSLSWLVVDDAIEFRRWDWGASIRSARSEGVTRRQVFKPVSARRIGYHKNQAPMARGDIAAAVLIGLDAQLITMSANKSFAKYNKNDAYVGGAITFTAIRQNIPGTQTFFRVIRVSDDHVLYGDTADNFGNPANYGGVFAGSGNDTFVIAGAQVDYMITAYGTFRVEAYRDGYTVTASVAIAKVKDGADAPLLLTQWSVDGSTAWHAEFTEGDIYQRQSNDNGATYGPAVKVVGDSVTGPDGITPATIFLRSPSVPATPADDTGNPPPGWSDGPTTGTGFIWQSNAKFRGTDQITSWSAPQRISGENGDDGVDGFVVTASVPNFTIPCYSNGTSKPVWTGGETTIRFQKGGVAIAPNGGYSVPAQTGVATLALDGNTVTFAGLTGDKGQFTVRATHGGIPYDSVVPVVKAKDGEAAFKGTTAIPATSIGGGSPVQIGSGSTTVPAGRACVLSASVSYSIDPQIVGTFTGQLTLYWRNITDDGPLNYLGAATGSQAQLINHSSIPGEPDYEYINGIANASFAFTAPSPDKQIGFYAYLQRTAGNRSVIAQGGMSLEVSS